jgi:phage repressor protein C with HTH and peptisase S24 domain
MADDREIGSRLALARQAAGFDSAADAAAALNVKYPTYAGHENGTRGLRRNIEKYARRFNVSMDWLLTGKGTPPSVENAGGLSRSAPKQLASNSNEPPNAFVRDKVAGQGEYIPLYGHAVGGVDGEFVLNGNVLDHILAPPGLRRIDGAYAVTVAGESMEPRYFDGETVFVNPQRRVKRGDFVVVQIKNPNEGSPPLAYIKRFVRHNDTELVLEQFNPAKEIRFPHSDVVHVHYIALGGGG